MWRSTHEDILLEHIITIAQLREKNGKLLKLLEQSKKNDSPKDPKTGRFTKK
jgi:hypothetical protein